MSESREAQYSRRDFLLYDKIMAGAPTVKATNEIDALRGPLAARLGERLTWAQWLKEQGRVPSDPAGRRVQDSPVRS